MIRVDYDELANNPNDKAAVAVDLYDNDRSSKIYSNLINLKLDMLCNKEEEEFNFFEELDFKDLSDIRENSSYKIYLLSLN